MFGLPRNQRNFGAFRRTFALRPQSLAIARGLPGVQLLGGIQRPEVRLLDSPEGVAGYACLNAWGVKEQIEKEKKKNFTPSWLRDLFSGMSQTKGPLNSSLTQICRHAGFPGSRHLFISKQRSKFQHHQQGRIPPFGWFCREIKFGRSQFVGIPKKGNNTPPNRVPRNPTSGTTQSIRGAAIHGRKAVRVRGVCVWMESET